MSQVRSETFETQDGPVTVNWPDDRCYRGTSELECAFQWQSFTESCTAANAWSESVCLDGFMHTPSLILKKDDQSTIEEPEEVRTKEISGIQITWPDDECYGIRTPSGCQDQWDDFYNRCQKARALDSPFCREGLFRDPKILHRGAKASQVLTQELGEEDIPLTPAQIENEERTLIESLVPDRECWYEDVHSDTDSACYADWMALVVACYAANDWDEEWCYEPFHEFDKVVGGVSLMGELKGAPETPGFDYTVATIGASVGFLAAYAFCKATRSKQDDAFARV